MTPQRREEDQHGITPRSNRERIERLEECVRRDRVRAIVLYVFAFACVIAALFQISHVQDLRRDRVALEQRTNRLICERQREAVSRLRETKQAQIRSDRVLATLITGILAVPPQPDRSTMEIARNKQVRDALIAARDKLTTNIDVLGRGRDRLRQVLDGVQCDRLPNSKPFRE